MSDNNILLSANPPRSLTARFHIDLPLLMLLLALTIYGLVVLYSASGQQVEAVLRQGLYFLVAYGVMLTVAQLKVHHYQRWAPFLYVSGLVLLLLVLLAGSGAKGAQRWLSIGGIRFQPSEIMKVLVPLMLARYLSTRMLPPKFWQVVLSLPLIAAPVVLVSRQPDLGTAMLIAGSGLFVLFMAGIGWRFFLGTALVTAVSAWPAWVYLLRDYQKQRIITMLNPESDKLGTGWNLIQSKTAIGSGGWSGKGWLNGTQSQLDFLPESHSDFIIAVLAEEFGLRGVLLLLIIYALILARGFLIGLRAQDSFSKLLAGSLTLTFFMGLFVNMGMVAGLLPVVGVPLPLMSAGGTSLVTFMGCFGILMAIGTRKQLVR